MKSSLPAAAAPTPAFLSLSHQNHPNLQRTFLKPNVSKKNPSLFMMKYQKKATFVIKSPQKTKITSVKAEAAGNNASETEEAVKPPSSNVKLFIQFGIVGFIFSSIEKRLQSNMGEQLQTLFNIVWVPVKDWFFKMYAAKVSVGVKGLLDKVFGLAFVKGLLAAISIVLIAFGCFLLQKMILEKWF